MSSHAAPSRRVRRLTVKASGGEAATEAAVLLTDALSTASLPGADRGRVILIRRLALGRISPRASAASLALRIESAAEAIASEIVTYDAAGADAATGVSFPDRATAIVALARCHAARMRAAEWFWSRVVDGWNPDATTADRWLRVVEAAHRGPDAALIAAAIVDAAIRAHAVDDLLSSIPAGYGARWLAAEGWLDVSAGPIAGRPLPIVGSDVHAVQRWSARWAPTDDRLVWFATMREVTRRPQAVADPRLPARVESAIARLVRPAMPSHFPQAARRARDAELGAPADTASQMVDVGHRRAPASGTAMGPGADRSSPEAHARAAHEAIEHGDANTSWPERESTPPHGEVDRGQAGLPEGAVTFFAGLFFVVPVLQRLGFDAFLAANPTAIDEGFPARLLEFIGQRAGMPPNDPLALAFADRANTDDAAASTNAGAMAGPLSDRARALLSMRAPRAPLTSPLDLWLTLVRRWCRRHAHMGVATLVRRPGRIHLSRTHVDISFPLSQLDVRVRRIALDVNPGWVAWIARIVEFRYEEHDAW